ncbi:MAG: hypothetical protein AB8I08_31070 [Sandaracinaceae bacterium]
MSDPLEQRHSPLVSQVALIVGFILMVAAGVVTVLVPELSSDDETDTPTTTETPADDASDPPAP